MAKEEINSSQDELNESSDRVKLLPGRTPPKPFTKADNEAHLKVVAENIRRNAGKPMH
ncbi:hypothetical protein [Edaphobacter dinghuensis]|uniref:Uncharacterized protein n=1 Tax=Edaphobacter dinghuensis TaxID=1560005 RepID=A0A917H0E5_9BACT|nr:hypothetical protein [Edaphobacter dinghuensis]GGG63472.1 hypothetical protein GCM10011585_01240 [Edaphobacter dinghuensis]